MELLTYKSSMAEYTYYLDKNGKKVLHGRRKYYHTDGKLWMNAFKYHGKWHGEYKRWTDDGDLIDHIFYINDKRCQHVEMDDQEKLLFQIQHPGFRFIEE